MKSWMAYARPIAVVAAAAFAFGACDEQLNGGGACPALCPGKQIQMQDTTFFAVDLDTTVAGFPSLGEELRLFLAAKGDTLTSGAVIRFDSLPERFRRVNNPDDSAIVAVDSAFLRLTVVRADTTGNPTTLDVYNVDMDGAEEADPTSVTAAFIAANLLGSRTIPADSLKDTLSIPIDNATLLTKVQTSEAAKRRMRFGIRVRDGSANTKFTLIATNGGGAPRIVFRPSLDTTVPKIEIEPLSRTPTDPAAFRLNYEDYQVVLKSTPEPPPDVFRIGGIPSRRAYLHFNIPSSILDSSSVVRATLQMTQRPSRFSPDAKDTVGIGHFGIVASPSLTDLSRVLTFIDRLPSHSDTLKVSPADSGQREFEIIGWVRVWRGTQASKTTRALALALPSEGVTGSVVDFFSIESSAAVRPRLRITYLPRTEGTLR